MHNWEYFLCVYWRAYDLLDESVMNATASIGSNLEMSSRWPAIHRYSWLWLEEALCSSGFLEGGDGVEWLVVEDDFDLIGWLNRRMRGFKNRYRAKQQSFSK